jgi:hypothetical protein
LISVFVYLHIFAAIYTQAALSFDGVLSTRCLHNGVFKYIQLCLHPSV